MFISFPTRDYFEFDFFVPTMRLSADEVQRHAVFRGRAGHPRNARAGGAGKVEEHKFEHSLVEESVYPMGQNTVVGQQMRFFQIEKYTSGW